MTWKEDLRTIFAPEDAGKFHNMLPYLELLHATAERLQPRVIVEIGVRAGYSSWVFSTACPDALILGIDADTGTHGGFSGAWRNAERIMAGKRWLLLTANSRDVQRLPACDLCYVDGDHTESGCHWDLLLAAKTSRWILVDDYHREDLGVKAACDRFEQTADFTAESIGDEGRLRLFIRRESP